MTHHVIESTCRSIFDRAVSSANEAEKKRTELSTAIDDAQAAMRTSRTGAVVDALAAVWNRVLDPMALQSVQQVRNAAQGGRQAVNAIKSGHDTMAQRAERAAAKVDDITIRDGKKVGA